MSKETSKGLPIVQRETFNNSIKDIVAKNDIIEDEVCQENYYLAAYVERCFSHYYPKTQDKYELQNYYRSTKVVFDVIGLMEEQIKVNNLESGSKSKHKDENS